MTIRCTEKGLAEYRKILSIVFSSVKQLLDVPFEEFNRINEELAKMHDLSFTYSPVQNALEMCNKFSARLTSFQANQIPVQNLLKYHHLKLKVDYGMIQDYVTELVKQQRLVITLASMNQETDSKEPVYDTEFKIEDFQDVEILEEVNFKIPTKNEYLPQNVEIRKGEEQKYPEEVKVEHEHC